MRGWVLIGLLFVSGAVSAASQVTTRNRLSVYLRPDDRSGVVFSIPAGQAITVSDGSKNGFRKVRAEVDGRLRTGFVSAEDLKIQRETRPSGTWALGGGGIFSRFSQASKSFSTGDQVTYTTTSYTGQSLTPALTLQFGDRSFWRVSGYYRSLELSGSASTNIPGAASQTVKLTYQMLGVGAELGWSLWQSAFYFGGGAGYDRTLSGMAFLGSQDLTSVTEMPSFIHAHGLLGVKWQIASRWAVFADGRFGAVVNQSPMVMMMEATVQALYWP